MSKPVHVPHRSSLPEAFFGRRPPAADQLLEDSPYYEAAYDLAYDECQGYAGHPDVQRDVLETAIDDLSFTDEVNIAARRIADIVVVSGLYDFNGAIVKDETQQLTNAYKIRGATNFIFKHIGAACESGVITASAGNHGQGVALVAAKLGVRAVIVVPEGTPNTKKNGITAEGGEVVEYGKDYAAASRRAHELNSEQHGLYVPAYDHRDIMAGQATVARELMTQVPHMTDVIVPTGGGGLLAGTAKYLAIANPSVRVWAAGVAGYSAAATAFRKGNGGSTPTSQFADGIAVSRLGDETWPEIKRHAEGALEVSEHSLRRMVGRLSFAGHIVEGAGAAGITAAEEHRQRLGHWPVAIATGGNIDPAALSDCQLLALGASRLPV